MDNISELILKDREERINKIKSLLEIYNVLSLKINVMGSNKNTRFANVLLRLYESYIDNNFYNKDYKYITKTKYLSYDGTYVLYTFPKDVHLKNILVKIEESEEVGRLLDLDFYEKIETVNDTSFTYSIRRSSPRKCLICDEDVYTCMRKRKHSLQELINKAEELTYNKIEKMISKAIKDSMLMELDLHPKFGLVTPFSNGSHNDMNYDLMRNSQEVIFPYLVKMFKVGYFNEKLDIFDKINKIGKDAEKAMYEYTNNINTYKGLIFCLGLFVAAIGYVMANNLALEDVFLTIKEVYIASDHCKICNTQTYGYKVYKELNFGGVRKEASLGFPSVKNSLNVSTSTLVTLVHLITISDDSVLLKRCGTKEKYNQVTEVFKKLNCNDLDEVNNLTEEMIEENLSFGGSADLLVCTLFVRIVQSQYNLI